MSNPLDQELAALALRFDQQIALLDASIAQKLSLEKLRLASSSSQGTVKRLKQLPKPLDWTEAQVSLDRMRTLQKMVFREANMALANVGEWERRAILCLRAKDEALARAALDNQRAASHQAAALDVQARQLEAVVEEFRSALEELQRKSRER